MFECVYAILFLLIRSPYHILHPMRCVVQKVLVLVQAKDCLYPFFIQIADLAVNKKPTFQPVAVCTLLLGKVEMALYLPQG